MFDKRGTISKTKNSNCMYEFNIPGVYATDLHLKFP